MPGEEFLALVEERDAALAECFGVPIEQVPVGGPSFASRRTGPGRALD
jgi:hypothetical protein